MACFLFLKFEILSQNWGYKLKIVVGHVELYTIFEARAKMIKKGGKKTTAEGAEGNEYARPTMRYLHERVHRHRNHSIIHYPPATAASCGADAPSSADCCSPGAAYVQYITALGEGL